MKKKRKEEGKKEYTHQSRPGEEQAAFDEHGEIEREWGEREREKSVLGMSILIYPAAESSQQQQ